MFICVYVSVKYVSVFIRYCEFFFLRTIFPSFIYNSNENWITLNHIESSFSVKKYCGGCDAMLALLLFWFVCMQIIWIKFLFYSTLLLWWLQIENKKKTRNKRWPMCKCLNERMNSLTSLDCSVTVTLEWENFVQNHFKVLLLFQVPMSSEKKVLQVFFSLQKSAW